MLQGLLIQLLVTLLLAINCFMFCEFWFCYVIAKNRSSFAAYLIFCVMHMEIVCFFMP
ncbi:hypothetical protein Hanom_Chr10g00898611 [Helianthus anomalus]